MTTTRLLTNAINAGTASEVLTSQGTTAFPQGALQVDVVGSAGVAVLQGRAAPDAPWATIVEVTAPGLTAIAVMPQMRMLITAGNFLNPFNVWVVAP